MLRNKMTPNDYYSYIPLTYSSSLKKLSSTAGGKNKKTHRQTMHSKYLSFKHSALNGISLSIPSTQSSENSVEGSEGMEDMKRTRTKV